MEIVQAILYITIVTIIINIPINVIIYMLPDKWKLKADVAKRFVGCESPIYLVQAEDEFENDSLHIYEYELQYVPRSSLFHWLFVTFSQFELVKRYEVTGHVGPYTYDEITNIDDLGTEYKRAMTELAEEYIQFEKNSNEEQSVIDNLNRKFWVNYKK